MPHLHDPIQLTCRHYQNNETITIDFDNGHVHQLKHDPKEYNGSLLYAPVFIDLQINGYQGINFSDSTRLTENDVYQVVKTLWSHGVAYFLPTITTNSFENILNSFKILTSCRQNAEIARSVPGYHLEGPYISSEDGPRGAHPLEHARAPSWEEFTQWQEAANGLIKLVTLAPELSGAIPFIEKLRSENIIPAIGHTNAQTNDIKQAVEAGAVLSTHLGNGAHATIRRHPNYIWDQLAEDALWASLICDGFHLPPNVVKVMTRSKGVEKSILVTDAVMIAGLDPGQYNAFGKKVELTADGVVKLSGTDYLAGAALKMSDAVFNTAKFTGLEPQTAIKMASEHPNSLLQLHADVSLNIFDEETFLIMEWDDEHLKIIATVINEDLHYYQDPTKQEGEKA